MADAQGYACCRYCGAEYRLFTIFNRDMRGLCKGWKNRHERGCEHRTPAQRRKWAAPYVGKDRYDSSIVVDLSHPGFQDAAASEPPTEFELWFGHLALLVLEATGIEFRDPDAVREDFEAGRDFADVAAEITAEYNQTNSG